MTIEISADTATRYRQKPENRRIIEQIAVGGRWKYHSEYETVQAAKAALVQITRPEVEEPRPEAVPGTARVVQFPVVESAAVPLSIVEGLQYDYEQIPSAYREMVQRAALRIKQWQRDTIEVGKLLLQVKDVLRHRHFMEWLRIEFDLKERSVQSMINVALVYGEIDVQKAQRVALLSTGALYELAAPSTPATARAEVEAMIDGGQTPTRAQVRDVIDKHKPPKPPPKMVKKLTGPEADSEPVIEGDYTVIPKHEFIFPGHQKRADEVQPVISRALAQKLQAAVLTRILKAYLTPHEVDELLIALTRALEE